MRPAIDFPPPPEHCWNEIRRSGQAAAVAYVCASCGERRPRGRAIVLPGELSADKRDELEQAGYEVLESPFVSAGQVMVMDGRFSPAGEDEFLWCVQPTAVA